MYTSYLTTNSANRIVVPTGDQNSRDSRDNKTIFVEKNGLGVVGNQRQDCVPTETLTVVYLGKRF